MAAALLPAEPAPAAAPECARGCLAVPVPRPLTRCECAGVSFTEVARRIFVEGEALPDVLRRTGCGQTCGACIPDLHRHLAQRG